MINAQIFRQYDVRGIVDKDLTDESVYLLGKGYGRYLRKQGMKSVAISGDARLSTPRFMRLMKKGMMDCGCVVKDIGITATPVLYFAIQELDTDGGVMITGSHNPPEYNGFKLNVGLMSIYGEQIQDVRKIIEAKDFISGEGSEEAVPGMIQIYQDYVVANIKLARSVKVIIDAGNGAGGPILPDILRRIGCDVTELYCELDGTFPNHHPDPTVMEYIQDLIWEVRNTDAELGLGLDGDADRIGVIDEKGNAVYGDMILNIYARDFLRNYPGEKVIGDVKCSKNLYDDIKLHGGIPVMYKTGHSMIKKQMKAENIKLGGEMSGHIFFADRFFGFDDAMYACCRFLEIVSRADKPVSRFLEDQPKMFNTPEIREDCTEETKFDIVDKVRDEFRNEGFEVNDIDGVRVTFPDGWGLVRASNTQAVLVLRFEAETESRLNEIRTLFEEKIRRIKSKN
ncbi:MAG: phosphomannomutase/phosphoglucomutase [Candidatus Cloacimonetes bacterium]|nr:phosphomannomutase/phosphoglucomutase [Candidatus Cloacimonadota bacterium]